MKDKIPESLAPYFSFHVELTIHDGLIFKGPQVKTSCKPHWHTGITKKSQRVQLLAEDKPGSEGQHMRPYLGKMGLTKIAL